VRRLTGFRSFALLIAFLWAFHNSARFFSHWVLTEALSATLMCVFTYALVRGLLEGDPRRDNATVSLPSSGNARARNVKKYPLLWFGVAGAVMFLLAWVRPSCSLLAIPVCAGVLFTHFFLYRRRRQGVALVMLLLIFPLSSQEIWALRNYVVEGQWYFCRLSVFGVYAYGFGIPIDMSKGKSYVEAHHHVWNEYYPALDWMSPQAMDELYRVRMGSELRQYPGVVLSHYLGSAPMLFVPTLPIIPIGITPPFTEWSRLPWNWSGMNRFLLLNSIGEFATTCWILGMLGVGLFFRRRWANPSQQGFFITVLLVFAYWIAVHAISARYTGYIGAARFFLPLVPLLLVGAANVMARMPGIAALQNSVEPAHQIYTRDPSPPVPSTG
jgi:hypothetical protein